MAFRMSYGPPLWTRSRAAARMAAWGSLMFPPWPYSAHAPEFALDEVDRGEVAGVDPVAVRRLEVEGAQRRQGRRVRVGKREVRIDQVVLVDPPEDVERVKAGDHVLDPALHRGRQQSHHRLLDAGVAGQLIDPQLLLARGPTERERRAV